MLTILSLTGVIFVLIAVGYLLATTGVFTAEHMQALSHYVVLLALPALIFRAVAGNPLDEIINPAYMLSYLLASLTLFIGFYLWASRRHGARRSTAPSPAWGCPVRTAASWAIRSS